MDIRKLLKPGEFVLGLDIGGTKMLAAVFDHEFRVVAQAKKKSKTGGESDVNASAEQRVIGVITEAIQAAGAPPVRGIGVGSPGPLDPATGIIIDTPNLGWKNFPLAERLREKFGVPVLVDNDVNVGTYGEWRFGKVSDCRHVVGIFPGTGIGGGIIVDGKMLHGFSGAAGEVGHMTVEPGGPFCGCGKRGCLEAVASRIAIAKEVAALAAREDAPLHQTEMRHRPVGHPERGDRQGYPERRKNGGIRGAEGRLLYRNRRRKPDQYPEPGSRRDWRRTCRGHARPLPRRS